MLNLSLGEEDSLHPFSDESSVTHHFRELFQTSDSQPEFLLHLLRHYPLFPMVVMLNKEGDENPSSSRTVQLLADQAMEIVKMMEAHGVQKGDRVVLVFFPSVEFYVALWACYLGGFVGIPVPPPIRLTSDLLSFSTVVEKTDARFVLSHNVYFNFSSLKTVSHKVSSYLSPSSWWGGGKKQEEKEEEGETETISWPAVSWIYVDGPCSRKESSINYSKLLETVTEYAGRIKGDDLAHLQMTSGSTAFPKLVKITHKAVILNVLLVIADQNHAVPKQRMKEANYTKDSCPWSPLKKSCASCGAVATNSCTKCYLPYCYECSANLEEGKCLAGGEHWFPRVPKLIQPPVNSSYHRSVVLWIPHFHDFFMFHIPAALIYCCRLCLLSPVDFLAKPLIWLKACHQFKATETCAPNFALDLAVSKSTQEQRDQLSKEIPFHEWTCFVTQGGEPLHKKSFERFSAAFPFIRLNFYINALGMAEAVAGVCASPLSLKSSRKFIEKGMVPLGEPIRFLDAGDPEARACFSCGFTEMHLLGRNKPGEPTTSRVIVVHPETMEELPDGHIGEVWCCSPGYGSGYWGWSDEDNDALFAAVPSSRITGEEGRTYLRSGDRGFILDGQVFLIGRIKSVLIFQGRNYEPSDIEYAVWGCHPNLRPGCCAALSIPDDELGTDVLVMIAEVRDENLSPDGFEQTAFQMREVLADGFGLTCPEILFFGVKKGIVKTTSGKPKRNAIMEKYVRNIWKPLYVSKQDSIDDIDTKTGDFDDVIFPEGSEEKIIKIFQELLEDPTAGTTSLPDGGILDATLSAFSVTSSEMVRIQNLIKDEFGVYIPSGVLLRVDPNSTTVRHLFAHYVFSSSPTPLRSPPVSPNNTPPASPFATDSPATYSPPPNRRMASCGMGLSPVASRSRSVSPQNGIGKRVVTPNRTPPSPSAPSSPRGAGGSYLTHTQSSAQVTKERKKEEKKEKKEKKEYEKWEKKEEKKEKKEKKEEKKEKKEEKKKGKEEKKEKKKENDIRSVSTPALGITKKTKKKGSPPGPGSAVVIQ